jgi:hypothetical protein
VADRDERDPKATVYAQGVRRTSRREDGRSELSIVLELDEERFTAARAALNKVNSVLDRRETDMVRASFDVLAMTFSFHSHLLSRSLTGSQSITQAAIPSISAHIFGWLSTTRLFLDHSLSLLSREFGKDSPQFERFEKGTNWAYDHSISYRFVDQLRNAFQHSGVPPLSVHAALNRATGERELHLIADREALLAYYKWKKKVREDLSSLAQTIDVYGLLAGAVVQFEFLAAQVRDILRSEAIEPTQHLAALLAEVAEPHDALSLVELRYERKVEPDESLEVNTSPLDLGVIERVRRMPVIAEPPQEVLDCIGDLGDGAVVMGVCGRQSASVVAVPHKGGVGFLPVCDLHQRDAGRWAVRRLGAGGLIHLGIMEYMASDLSGAGYRAAPVLSVLDLLALERTDEPLPEMGLDLSPSGWKVSRHPEVLKRTRRAIDALTAWTREGGGTDAFFTEISGILDEDQNVEPLLTGLINLSGTLLHAVASVHGRSTESILGSLAEEVLDTHLQIGHDAKQEP